MNAENADLNDVYKRLAEKHARREEWSKQLEAIDYPPLKPADPAYPKGQ